MELWWYRESTLLKMWRKSHMITNFQHLVFSHFLRFDLPQIWCGYCWRPVAHLVCPQITVRRNCDDIANTQFILQINTNEHGSTLPNNFLRFPTIYNLHFHSTWSPFHDVSREIFRFWVGLVILILYEKPSATDLFASSCLLKLSAWLNWWGKAGCDTLLWLFIYSKIYGFVKKTVVCDASSGPPLSNLVVK